MKNSAPRKTGDFLFFKDDIITSEPQGKEISELLIKQARLTEPKLDIIEELLQLSRAAKDMFCICVQWERLPDDVYHTWKDIEQLYDDVTDMVEDFLLMQRQTKDVKEA